MFSSRQICSYIIVVALFFPHLAFGLEVSLPFNDKRGEVLLRNSFNDDDYWKDITITRYKDHPYDEIRLKPQNEGYVTYISGTGSHSFTSELVSEGVYKHQDLIPTFMPALKVSRYIGDGLDPKTGLEYTDIYFLADIKLFFMSVPLRTTRVHLGEGRYICTIELITEDMVTAEKWTEYQEVIEEENKQVMTGWAFQGIVPMEYVYGYYLIEPEETIGSRATMITQMKFKKNVNILVDIGSDIPFVLRQGMSAGFIGSVEACKAYMKILEETKEGVK
jgi:hypothetical protein